jgi:HD-GYP domain-containing protein (c-di-GMP phosphodiesterase class II)
MVENKPPSSAAPTPPATGERSPADGWDVLDRFVRDLARCQDRPAATRRFLAAVLEGLGADTVFCCSVPAGRSVERIGWPAPPAWCQTLTRLALAAAPGVEGQLLLSNWSPPAELGPPLPRSLALVRLSRSRSLWAVAVTFDPARRFRPADMPLLVLARELLANTWQQQRAQQQLRQTVLGLVHGFTTTLDGRDRCTAGHSERVARVALRLGEQMELSPADLGDLYLAALLHDVGMVHTGEEILQKPGPLTAAEMVSIQEHPVLAASIVSGISPIAHLAPIVRAHHERIDGQGYPDGLAGEAIPLLARILAVADSTDALLAHRPYRAALAHPQQLAATLNAGAGSQWDKRIVGHLLACLDEICALARAAPHAEVRDQKSEVRDQKSEVRDQRSEVRGEGLSDL